jgi:hypothetical protein
MVERGSPLPPSERSRPPRRGSSIALICIGLLILVPSGLCTAALGIGFLSDLGSRGQSESFAGLIWVVLMVGGPPIAIGIALFVWGLRRDRR